MKVSAVIPSYNYGRFLGEAIESVLAQTYPAHEIIVVDDGSTDDTPEVMRRYRDKTRYIRTENRGVSRTRNTGLETATGELIAFLDADDRWLPHKLERQVPLLSADHGIGLLHARSRVFDHRTAQTLCEPLIETSLDVHALIRCCAVSAPSAVVPRTVFEQIGGFDENLVGTEDWDMWLRIAVGYRIVGLDEVLAEYRSHGQSLSGHAGRQFRNQMAVLDKVEGVHPGCRLCRQALRYARGQMRREYFAKINDCAREARREGRTLESWKLRFHAMWVHPGFVRDLPARFRRRKQG